MQKQELEKIIRDILGNMGIAAPDITITFPEVSSHGDFTTNIALPLAKQLGKNPRELAAQIASEIQKTHNKHFLKVEAAGPGFINFTLQDEGIRSIFAEILKEGDSYGAGNAFKGKKYFVEYTQPNPFKEFHIGHLMNNTIGEAVSRLVIAEGAAVKRATYHGDVGLHVAKTIWGMQKLGFKNPTVADLGKAYATGNTAYEDTAEDKEIITAINKKVYDRSDAEINALYDLGRKISFEYFESLYKRLGSSFDYHFYESESGIIGKQLVETYLDKGIFEKSEGAVIFPGEKYGLHTRVFLNKEGLPTYEAKEIGLAKIKKDTYAYDESITVTANEQDAFFKVVEVAIGKVFPELEGKLHHLSHGMLKLPSGKMSSRTGTVITAESLLEQVKGDVMVKIKNRDMKEEDKEKVSEAVAIAAIKYAILRQAIGGDIIFDFKNSISFEGDSGPYLQYTATRAKSLLTKGNTACMQTKLHEGGVYPEELRKIIRYSAIVERSAKECAPHHLVTYLIDLAASFNAFYGRATIIDEQNKAASEHALALTSAVRTILVNGLTLLGIPVPEKM